jgi:hypothetical protein
METKEELRAELAYWTDAGDWFGIWYYTERIKELEEEDEKRTDEA